MFFLGFLNVMEVQYGPKIEENSLKMKVLAPRWAPLGDFGDFWVMLCHVGGKMATKSATMSQHRRQGPAAAALEDSKVLLRAQTGGKPRQGSVAALFG